MPNNMQVAEHVRNVFRVRVPDGATHEDIMQPMFWANEAGRITVDSIIEVVAHDRSWFAEYYVMSKGQDWVKVSLLRRVELEAKSTSSIPEGYHVEYVNDDLKWCATRLADQRRVISGQHDRESAIVWLNNYLRKAA